MTKGPTGPKELHMEAKKPIPIDLSHTKTIVMEAKHDFFIFPYILVMLVNYQ